MASNIDRDANAEVSTTSLDSLENQGHGNHVIQVQEHMEPLADDDDDDQVGNTTHDEDETHPAHIETIPSVANIQGTSGTSSEWNYSLFTGNRVRAPSISAQSMSQLQQQMQTQQAQQFQAQQFQAQQAQQLQAQQIQAQQMQSQQLQTQQLQAQQLQVQQLQAAQQMLMQQQMYAQNLPGFNGNPQGGPGAPVHFMPPAGNAQQGYFTTPAAMQMMGATIVNIPSQGYAPSPQPMVVDGRTPSVLAEEGLANAVPAGSVRVRRMTESIEQQYIANTSSSDVSRRASAVPSPARGRSSTIGSTRKPSILDQNLVIDTKAAVDNPSNQASPYSPGNTSPSRPLLSPDRRSSVVQQDSEESINSQGTMGRKGLRSKNRESRIPAGAVRVLDTATLEEEGLPVLRHRAAATEEKAVQTDWAFKPNDEPEIILANMPSEKRKQRLAAESQLSLSKQQVGSHVSLRDAKSFTNLKGNEETAVGTLRSKDKLPAGSREVVVVKDKDGNVIAPEMPASGFESVHLSEKELNRLQKKPTIRELKSLSSLRGKSGSKMHLAKSGSKVQLNKDEKTSTIRKRGKMDNEKARLGYFALRWREFKKWLEYQRNRRRDFIPIWMDNIRFIEGRFGVGITSYFVLLRWTFLLNLLVGAAWSFAIVLPGVIMQDWVKMFNLGLFPQNFLDGSGGFSSSFFFYCAYPPRLGWYNMRAAYLIVIVVFLVISFLMIIRSVRDLFVYQPDPMNKVDSARVFALAVFASWDYSITTEDAQKNMNFAISTNFKTLISKSEVDEAQSNITRWEYAKRVISRSIANILILLIFGLSGVWIFSSVSYDLASAVEKKTLYVFTNANSGPVLNTLQIIVNWMITQNATSIIAILNNVTTILFKSLGNMEMYHNPERETSLLISRSFLFKIASIYVLCYYFWGQYQSDYTTGWENQVGTKFYQLLLYEFLITTAVTVFSTAAFYVMTRQPVPFAIAPSILEIVYRQSIFWFGAVYAPIIPFLSTCTVFVLFYIKQWTLLRFSAPPRRIYSSFGQRINFLLFLLATLSLMSMPIGFALTVAKPSCGPHYGLASIYATITSIIDEMDPSVRLAFNFLGTAGFIGPLIIALSVWVYYLYAVAVKRNRRLKQLETELIAEREDKKYLMRVYKIKT